MRSEPFYFQFFLVFFSTVYALVSSTATCPPRHYRSLKGEIHSPKHKPQNATDYTYEIRVPDGHRVSLMFRKFTVEGLMPECMDDYVEIFIGCNYNSIGRYCSALKYLHIVESPDNCLVILFHSSTGNSTTQFHAEYQATLTAAAISNSEKCRSSHFEDDADQWRDRLKQYLYPESKAYSPQLSHEGLMFSPKWPQPYTSDKTCTWTIIVPDEEWIKLSFMHFHLERAAKCDNHDFVAVRGGDQNSTYYTGEVIAEPLCGKIQPFYVIPDKHYSKIFVRFHSDTDSISGRGFIAGYVTYTSNTEGPKRAKDKMEIGTVRLTIVVIILIGAIVFVTMVGVCIMCIVKCRHYHQEHSEPEAYHA